MTEPKRRGRPPKAKLLQSVEPNARVEGDDCPSCGQSVGHYDDCEVGMGVDLARELTREAVAADKAANAGHPTYEVVGKRTDMHDIAQAYALRVWNGQSRDVPRAEKLRRVAKALHGQGLSMEGVTL